MPKPLSSDDLPKGCGVSEATLHRYIPGGRDLGDGDGPGPDCHWYVLNQGTTHCPGSCPAGDADGERTLTVDVGVRYSAFGGAVSADGDALRGLDPADAYRVAAGGAERKVDVLGDEALYHYTPTDNDTDPDSGGGAGLRFRTGATVVAVTFGGSDSSGSGPDRPVGENEARSAVFAAATDIAKALRVRSAPAFTATAKPLVPPPAPRTLRPCELVPDAVADHLAPGANRGRPRNPVLGLTPDRPLPYGLAVDSCAWDADGGGNRPERHLIVTVWSESEWRPGIAVAQAIRLYLERHDDARAAAPSDFHAVRGLGDQAYATYQGIQGRTDIPGGQVIFRYRNLVADVDYYGGSSALDRKTAVNGAYTAATAVRKGLR